MANDACPVCGNPVGDTPVRRAGTDVVCCSSECNQAYWNSDTTDDMADGDRNYQNECGDHGGRNSAGDPCGRPAGWGTEFDDGKCKHHRGTSADGESHAGNGNAVGNDGGAPEGNRNAATHDLYTDEHAFYNEVAGDDLRALADKIQADWIERYRERHGDPTAGEETELFLCAVTVAKELHGESWAIQKPETMTADNALVDRERHISDSGQEYYQYEPTVVQQAINQLSRRRRQWLKDLKLLPDNDTADEVEITGLGSALKDLADE
jgi:hypothetical protein